MINMLEVKINKLEKFEKKAGKKPRKYNIIASDVENNPKTGEFLLAHIYGKVSIKNGEVIIDEQYKNQLDYNLRLLELTKFKNLLFVFYNLSYDEAFIRDIIDDSLTVRADSRPIKFGFKKGKIELEGKTVISNGGEIIDIQNISGIEYSLENWIKYLDMYNKIGIKKESLENLEERCRSDAIATWYLSNFIQDFIVDNFRIKLRPTIAGNSLAIYKNNFLPYKLVRKDDERINEIEHDSYFGGRNEIFIRGLLKIDSFDVRSMYLSIMRDCYMPIPNESYLIENPYNLSKNWKYYYDNYLGIFDVLVYVPKQKICPLPYFLNDKKKIVYPYGTFRGTYTSVELKNAEKYGLKILKVYKFVYYKKKDKIFENFAKEVWRQRLEYGSKCANKCKKCLYKDNESQCKNFVKNPKFNKAMDIMIKKIGNSCYGKFGERHYEVNYYGREKDLPKNIIKKVSKSDNFKVYSTYYDDELYVNIRSEEKKNVLHTFICISSFITSYARIKLLNEMKKHEDAVVYCDTDSIKLLSGQHNMIGGNDLGDFSNEYNNVEEYYFSPKNYGTRLKGVKKGSTLIEDNKKEGYKVFRIIKPNKFKTAIKSNKVMAKWEETIKRVTMLDDKRIWYGPVFYGQGIYSEPIKIEYNEE